MTANNLVIKELREALYEEISAIYQYFMYHRIAEYKGYGKLIMPFKQLSVAEMKHADALMGRILFLGGDLDMHMPNPVKSSRDISEIINDGLEGERRAIKLYNKIIAECEENDDHESANLVSTLLKEEEEHYDWFRKQRDVMDAVGITNYIMEVFSNEIIAD